ncbi:hypothetical protein PVAND_006939 [Polypedilum vanderplanki]|uniref:Zinc finger protein n=1 Tax=Polypedilum vanderplanki TaxID=319348 RepID=A0A9J6C6C9_POLVA|nr:hypothetical protein PVAND_006939 [Polypedilum vanderplanki]
MAQQLVWNPEALEIFNARILAEQDHWKYIHEIDEGVFECHHHRCLVRSEPLFLKSIFRAWSHAWEYGNILARHFICAQCNRKFDKFNVYKMHINNC